MFEMLETLLPEEERPTRIAILQEQTDWGVEVTELWSRHARENGYEIVAVEEYAPGSTDFTDSILQIQASGAEVLLGLPTPPDGMAIYRQMGELGYVPPFTLFIRAPDVPTWTDLGTVGDYVIGMPGWHNTLTFPGAEELNTRHIEQAGRPADPMVGPAYALTEILADSIERAGSLDRAAIRDAIAATDLDTVIGNVTFNENGTGNVVVPFLQYQEGELELVWPQEFATADLVYPAPPYGER
jgi:branched-chain amino acid transport system substrate-binding protein